MHRLKKIQKMPISLEKAWDFFSSPKNLKEITPDKLGFVIHTELPDQMYPGLFIQYTVKPILGFPMTWVTEITHIRDKEYFVDEQRLGPYQIWHHQHFFKEIEGGVEMTDIIDYRAPFGILGKVANALFIRSQLEEIFKYREDKMIELFGEFKKPILNSV